MDKGMNMSDAEAQQTFAEFLDANRRMLEQAILRKQAQERSEKTKAGMQAASKNGVKLGRPTVLGAALMEKARAMLTAGMRHKDVAKELGVSRSSIYRSFPCGYMIVEKPKVEPVSLTLDQIRAKKGSTIKQITALLNEFMVETDLTVIGLTVEGHSRMTRPDISGWRSNIQKVTIDTKPI